MADFCSQLIAFFALTTSSIVLFSLDHRVARHAAFHSWSRAHVPALLRAAAPQVLRNEATPALKAALPYTASIRSWSARLCSTTMRRMLSLTACCVTRDK